MQAAGQNELVWEADSFGDAIRIAREHKGWSLKELAHVEASMIDEKLYYLRNPDVVIVSTAQHYLFIDADGSVFELDIQNPGRWSRLMQDLMAPTRGALLRDRLAGPLQIDAVDLAPLLDRGCLLEAATPDELETRRDSVFTNNQGYYFKRGEQQCANLVVALTGSIIAGLMAPAILSLCYSGFHGQLELILTEAALRFATRELFEGYGIRTWVDAFDHRDGVHVPHITLGQSADCLLVLPATAACCRRLAHGDCADLLSLTVSATTAPVVVAPVMNSAMWNHAAVQRNVQQMRDDGMYIVEPTLIFAASELVDQGESMYGGPGTFWRGAPGVMATLVAAMEHHRQR
jgi:hypothetical protein